jgi:NADH:ubiquinone oxidoreductase subunit 6 (subunit J)
MVPRGFKGVPGFSIPGTPQGKFALLLLLSVAFGGIFMSVYLGFFGPGTSDSPSTSAPLPVPPAPPVPPTPSSEPEPDVSDPYNNKWLLPSVLAVVALTVGTMFFITRYFKFKEGPVVIIEVLVFVISVGLAAIVYASATGYGSDEDRSAASFAIDVGTIVGLSAMGILTVILLMFKRQNSGTFILPKETEENKKNRKKLAKNLSEDEQHSAATLAANSFDQPDTTDGVVVDDESPLLEGVFTPPGGVGEPSENTEIITNP